jgi:fructokinase
VAVISVLSPQRIIIGGGVMSAPGLFELVRTDVAALLNGYVDSPAVREEIGSFIVPPALGPRAGVLGAIALAQAL